MLSMVSATFVANGTGIGICEEILSTQNSTGKVKLENQINH